MWLVPYKTGELSVTANTNDQEVRYTLETTKEPVTILLHPIEEKRDMDQQDIVQVELFLADEKKRLVRHRDLLINASLCGDGVLLGMESGSPTDLTPYCEHTHRTFNGQMILYLRRNRIGGIKLRVFSPEQKELMAELEI